MNRISLEKRHLGADECAIYKDIFIDGEPFQEMLGKQYSSEFSQGRYKEDFLPILHPREVPFDFRKTGVNKWLQPIYGCQDTCCMYVYAETEQTDSEIAWLRMGRDSYFFGEARSDEHALVWLPSFKPLSLMKTNFERVFNLADFD